MSWHLIAALLDSTAGESPRNLPYREPCATAAWPPPPYQGLSHWHCRASWAWWLRPGLGRPLSGTHSRLTYIPTFWVALLPLRFP
jgi:hypothetical protein